MHVSRIEVTASDEPIHRLLHHCRTIVERLEGQRPPGVQSRGRHRWPFAAVNQLDIVTIGPQWPHVAGLAAVADKRQQGNLVLACQHPQEVIDPQAVAAIGRIGKPAGQKK